MVPESQYRELEKKVDALVQDAYHRGLQEGKHGGYNQGLSEGKAAAQQVIDQIQPVLTEINRTKNQIYTSAEKDILDLAMTIARKLVGALALEHQELVLDTIKKSLPLLLEKSKLTIKVAPQQEEFIKEQFDSIMAMDSDLKEITIEADRRIEQGGCVLETSSGRIDARIEKQLDVLTSALKKQIPNPEE
jgi:flagellar assembly protein FliH